MFDPKVWAAVPFHFWSLTAFVFGCVVGSFLNVCIHRMPLGQSIISPPSHCPHCKYSIPWYLNVPLITWLWLRGQCAQCRAPISIRYFLVELLTGVAFLASWLAVGRQSPWLAVMYWLILSGFMVATFIDFEHFIIPDEITLGGILVGFFCSFGVPELHGVTLRWQGLIHSLGGILVGAGTVYLVLRLGKLLFGKQHVALEPNTRVVFTENALVLPDQEIPYEELFYRQGDTVMFEAQRIELVDRCYPEARVRLSPSRLLIGEEEMSPESVPHLEAVTDKLVLPREAMGLGDVKFMGAIGAFLGWKATLFSLMASSMIGAVVGVILILLRKQEWSSRLPYGPYIALAATIWMFGGDRLMELWLNAGLRF